MGKQMADAAGMPRPVRVRSPVAPTTEIADTVRTVPTTSTRGPVTDHLVEMVVGGRPEIPQRPRHDIENLQERLRKTTAPEEVRNIQEELKKLGVTQEPEESHLGLAQKKRKIQDREGNISDLVTVQVPRGTVTTHILIAAEGALKHIGSSERKAKIKAAFLDLQIKESQYAVLAGFNEALIQSGFGYLEEVHVFCSIDIPNASESRLKCLLRNLGKVLTPYPGIIFTPSSGLKTPVFKGDGTIWQYDDLIFHHSQRHSDLRAKGILHSELNAFTSLGTSLPSISVTASGCLEGDDPRGNGSHGTGEDEGHGHSDNHNNPERNRKPEDDPEDPEDPEDAGGEDSSTPEISFDVQAKLFHGQGINKLPSSQPFQVLGIKGKLVVQTIPARLKPKGPSESHVEFRKLKFQSTESTGLVYEQVHVRVEIDTKDKDAEIDVLQPCKTSQTKREMKEIRANKTTMTGTLASSVEFIKTTAALSISGSQSKEASSSTEYTKYHSRITEWDFDGLVSWGFSVDDLHERQNGIEFGRSALPSVDFKFRRTPGPDERPPPPPERFDVLVTSCWSLISPGSESYVASSWFSWFKGLEPGTAASKVPLYSNLCQLVMLEVPSDLSQGTFYRSVSEVTQSSSKTVVGEQGLHKITPAVLFLGGQPIKSGDSYGLAISPSLRRSG